MEMLRKTKGTRAIIFCCYVIVSVFLISSCGGGGGGAAPTPSTGTAFWAVDFRTTSPTYYQTRANKAAEGTHCYIYIEQGLVADAAEIAAIRDEFDNNIYPTVRNAFGSEPNPGVDNDPKIYVLLLNIRDGFNGGSYTAGFYNSGNEYSVADNPHSNVKEMLYMNFNPALPLTATGFFTTLAHEFQHMIHWEQKTHLKSLDDDTWLDEAMSEIAPTYLYGPNYGRIVDYENAPSDSLTDWQGLVSDYGVAYMWSQYFKDQFDTGGGNIFKGIMQQNSTGITSVNSALTTTFVSKTFDIAFKDMSIAILSGNTMNWGGHPEWSYTSINTIPGTYSYGISNAETATLPGLFPIANTSNRNVSTLPALPIWSVGFYMYDPFISPPNGSIKWTASGVETAALIDGGNTILYAGITSGTTYPFDTAGFLIVSNSSGTAHGSVVYGSPSSVGSPVRLTPKQILSAANVHAIERGKSQDICVQSYFAEQEKELRAKGIRPGF